MQMKAAFTATIRAVKDDLSVIHRVSQGVGSFWLTAICRYGIFIQRTKELPPYFVKYAELMSMPRPLPTVWGETRVLSNAGTIFHYGGN